MVEPGSNESTAPRLRIASLFERLFLSFGLYDGQLVIAKISPVFTSTAIAEAERALFATPTAVNSRYIIYCKRESILSVIFSPAVTSFTTSGVFTRLPCLSREIFCSPSSPAKRVLSCISKPSIPSPSLLVKPIICAFGCGCG